MSNSDQRQPSQGGMVNDTEDLYMYKTPDKGWAWVVVGACTVVIMLTVGAYRTLGIVQVELMEVFDAPASISSLLFTSLGISVSITALLLSAAFGGILHERALVVLVGLIGSLGFVTASFAGRIESVVVVLGFAVGASTQLGMASTASIIGKYFKRRIGLANGIVMAGSGVGMFLLSPVLRFILDEYTFRGTLLIVGALLLNAFVCAALMKPVSAIKLRKSPDVNMDTAKEEIKSETLLTESKTNKKDSMGKQKHSSNMADAEIATPLSFPDTIIFEAKYFKSGGATPNTTPSGEFSCVSEEETTVANTANSTHGFDRQPNDTTNDTGDGNSEPMAGPSGTEFGPDSTDLCSNPGCEEGNTTQNIIHDEIISVNVENPTSLENTGEERTCGCKSSRPSLLLQTYESFFLVKRIGEQKPFSIREVFALDLFKNTAFILFQIFSFLSAIAIENLVQFYPASVKDIGIPDSEAALLLSIIGISDLSGRVLIGWFGDFGLIERYKIVVISQILLGVVTNLLFLGVNFWSQVLFSLLIGSQSGVHTSTRSVLLIQYFGLDALPKTVAVTLCSQGLGMTLGSQLVGWLRDFTGGYQIPMHILGTLNVLSGLLLCVIHIVRTVKLRSRIAVMQSNAAGAQQRDCQIMVNSV